jgi:hypothetical protein
MNKKTNPERQVPVIASKNPPITGAAIVAVTVKLMKSEKSRAAALPEEMSAAIARAIAIPAPPAKPWMNRIASKMPIVEESATPRLATAAIAVVMMTMRRRPRESDIGPKTS